MSIDKINIYKIKSTVTEFNQFIKTSDLYELNLPSGVEGFAHFRTLGGNRNDQERVPWLRFINTALDEDEKFGFTAVNYFPSAIVGLKISKPNGFDFFALTFGIGADGLLEKEVIVRDFGIKVAMNICDPEKLKRIQTTAHESITTQTERQVSTGTNIEFLNIDNEKEFLRTLAGSAKSEYSDIASFKGKENISLKFSKDVAIDWSYLSELIKDINQLYSSEEYKSTFTSYDKFHLETDTQIIETLNNQLFEKIRAANYENIHLSPPEFFDYDNFSFCYDNDQTSIRYNELILQDLLTSHRPFTENSTIHNTFKKWKIFKHDSERGNIIQTGWDAYKCIVAEIIFNAKTYILSCGQWKEASPDFAAEVNGYMNEILTSNDTYLQSNISIWCTTHNQNREDIYNKAVAADQNIFLFDKGSIEIDGEKRYELCDLLHNSKLFIHVKRFTSGTASISYLFTQGRFYTDSFASDKNCRNSIIQYIENNTNEANSTKDKNIFKSVIPVERVDLNAKDFTVVFCILTDRQNLVLENLPFMAKYELMKTHKYLTEDRGFLCNVAIRTITLGHR